MRVEGKQLKMQITAQLSDYNEKQTKINSIKRNIFILIILYVSFVVEKISKKEIHEKAIKKKISEKH